MCNSDSTIEVPFVETDCTIIHDGQGFTSGGAIVTDGRIIAYLANDGKLTDWHGNAIGTYRIKSSWRIWSCLSDRMFQIQATVNGVKYNGRSLGVGMSFAGKRARR